MGEVWPEEGGDRSEVGVRQLRIRKAADGLERRLRADSTFRTLSVREVFQMVEPSPNGVVDAPTDG